MRPMPVGLLGRIAMPCTASSPCAATSDGREILDADARAAGHDDDVRVGMERRANGIRIVAHEAGEVDDRAVAFGEGGEHRSVGVGDLEVVRLPCPLAEARCR